jgi:hypothetical protein
MRKIFSRLKQQLLSGIAKKEDLDRLYDQMAGLFQIQAAISGSPIIRPLRNWAISPDAIALVLADLQERTTPTIVEFGSGQSTVVLAAYLKNRRGGRLVTIEHDGQYAQGVSRQLAACGLEEYVDLRVVPLVNADSCASLPPCSTYDLSGMEKIKANLALVDGPPQTFGASGRYYAIRWAVSHLAADGVVYVDDYDRPADKRNVSVILGEIPAIRCETLIAEKGLVRLSLGQTGLKTH